MALMPRVRFFFAAALMSAVSLVGCSGTDDPTSSLRLGSVDAGGQFNSGQVRVNLSEISSGGSTGFSVVLADSSGGPVILDPNPPAPEDREPGMSQVEPLRPSEVAIDVSSPCAEDDRASIDFDSPADASSPVPARLDGTYTDEGCGQPDEITVRVSVSRDGSSYVARGTVNIAPPEIGTIEFLVQSEDELRVRGIGEVETSELIFAVRDMDGEPARGREVEFTVDGDDADLVELSPEATTTDTNGEAVTIVRSGTQPTRLRVTGTIARDNGTRVLSSQSDEISVVSGIPAQDRASLGSPCFALEGDTIEGETIQLQWQSSDRFGAPAADGSVARFASDAGAVTGSCVLEDGQCNVTFRTQAPRNPSGIATIIGFAEGEESFVDVDGDGQFSQGDDFTDLGDAFIDTNDNGVYDDGERFFDVANTGSYSGPDSEFSGYVCDESGECELRPFHVRDSLRIVMATSDADIALNQVGGDATFIDSRTVEVPENATAVLRFQVQDGNGNVMAGGTSVRLVERRGDSPFIAGISPSQDEFACRSVGGDGSGFEFTVDTGSLVGSAGPGERLDVPMELQVQSPSGALTSLPFDIVSTPQTGLPTVDLVADADEVEVGDIVTLTLASSGAEQCQTAFGINGTEGVQSVTINQRGAQQFTATCSNDVGQASDSVTVTGIEPDAPVITFTASPTVLNVNEQLTLTYEAGNADNCTAQWGNNLGTSGSRNLRPSESGFIEYEIQCSNQAATVSEFVEVEVQEEGLPPLEVSLTANPTVVAQNERVDLAWNSNAESCSAQQGWTVSNQPSGADFDRPDQVGFTTYTIVCNRGSDQVLDQVEVEVQDSGGAAPEPTVELTATPDIVQVGERVDLDWTSTADSCEAVEGWSIKTSASGSDFVRPQSAGFETYSIECESAGGTAVDVVEVEVLEEPAPQDPPEVTLTANPMVVGVDDRVDLAWSSDGDSCSAVEGWTPKTSASGSDFVRPSEEGFDRYSINCTNDAGSTIETVEVEVQSNTPPPPEDAPSVSFTATPSQSVAVGERVDLTWNSDGDSCEALEGWSAKTAPSGTDFDRPSEPGFEAYSIRCSNESGSTVESLEIEVQAGGGGAPTVELTATPDVVQVGERVDLDWTSTADSCEAVEGWSIKTSASGSDFVRPQSAGFETYSIECESAGGTAVDVVEVEVLEEPAPQDPPEVTLTANPMVVGVDDRVDLAWSSDGDSCSAVEGWTPKTSASGSDFVRPSEEGFDRYSINCTNDAGSTIETVEVEVQSNTPPPPEDPPSVSFTAQPSQVVTVNERVDLTWNSDADSCESLEGWSAKTAPSGTDFDRPSEPGFETYSIRCSNESGSTVESLEIEVQADGDGAPPVVNFTVAPQQVSVGGRVDLIWSSDADSCEAVEGWSEITTADGEDFDRPSEAGFERYTLRCENEFGDTFEAREVEVTQ